jgi:hypothetical protein
VHTKNPVLGGTSTGLSRADRGWQIGTTQY